MSSLRSKITFKDASVPKMLETNEHVTGLPGLRMIEMSGIMQDTNHETLNILDNACGAGVMTSLVLQLAPQFATKRVRITAADIDGPKMLAVAKKRGEANGWKNVSFEQFDMQNIPLADNLFTHTFTCFGVYFCADPQKALNELFRVTKSGGVIALTSWPYISWWPIAEAAIRTIPGAPALPSPEVAFPSQHGKSGDSIKKQLETAGFSDVNAETHMYKLDVDAKDWALSAAFLTKLITNRLWSKEDNEKYAKDINDAMVKQITETMGYKGRNFDYELASLVVVGTKP